jgi:Zinc finger C-x8-C-x5-C-x3-H type (and similar)/FMR1-interacting protein 1 (NUFIP1)
MAQQPPPHALPMPLPLPHPQQNQQLYAPLPYSGGQYYHPHQPGPGAGFPWPNQVAGGAPWVAGFPGQQQQQQQHSHYPHPHPYQNTGFQQPPNPNPNLHQYHQGAAANSGGLAPHGAGPNFWGVSPHSGPPFRGFGGYGMAQRGPNGTPFGGPSAGPFRGGGGGRGGRGGGRGAVPVGRRRDVSSGPVPARGVPAPQPVLAFRCTPCDKGFQTQGELDRHVGKHLPCPVADCDFSADRMVVHLHKMREHGSSRVKFVARPLETPEEIAQYVALRKRRFPTKKRRAAAAAAVSTVEALPSAKRARRALPAAEDLADAATEASRLLEEGGWLKPDPVTTQAGDSSNSVFSFGGLEQAGFTREEVDQAAARAHALLLPDATTVDDASAGFMGDLVSRLATCEDSHQERAAPVLEKVLGIVRMLLGVTVDSTSSERSDGLDVADLVEDDDEKKKDGRREKPVRPCNNFRRGSCKFGAKCRFAHDSNARSQRPTHDAAASLLDKLTERERDEDLLLALKCMRFMVRNSFGGELKNVAATNEN